MNITKLRKDPIILELFLVKVLYCLFFRGITAEQIENCDYLDVFRATRTPVWGYQSLAVSNFIKKYRI